MDNEPAPANHPGHQSRPTSDTDSNAAGLVASSVPSSSSSQASSSLQLRWRPCQLVFCPYSRPTETEDKPRSLRVLVRKSLLAGLTKGIVETYQICNPQFMYVEELNPKRYLTSPSSRVLNDGNDNENSDLILSVNYALVNSEKHRSYVVKDVLGHGTFGQVAKCWFAESNSFVAVKIIKNQPAFYQQALVEVSILAALNTKYDPEDQNHIVRIYDYFVHQRHLCIAFELLDTNLYELIKINSFRGLSLKIVQLFSKQILLGLILMKDAGIIHCDLKPENILLCARMDPVGVKIIDFGSACMEGRTVYSYIQSRYYRSPEVVLGYQYTTAIDMWSLGCIVAELYLGLPLFPGASEFDLLRRMIKILGGQPPDYILQEAKNTSKYFKSIGSVRFVENGGVTMDGRSAFQILTEAEYEVRELKKPAIGKEYFNYMDLEAIVRNFPYRKNLAQEDIAKESQIRLALIDFLRGLVEFDPAKRWSPSQASKHPFVTGEPFTCPYVPPPETPRMPVSQNVKIDHHPGGGHWFAAGLSPNIPGRGRAAHHHSPQYHMVPHAHPNSYGSLGSCGSYNDSGNSHGSYGDCSSMFAYFSPAAPPGMNRHAHGSVSIGTSPDARWRFVQQPHGNVLGVSPSAGSLGPLPFANSPLQFTPPNSCNHLSAGSPGHYGPTSPARSGCHGSPLAKMAASGQLNRRKSLGYGGNVQPLPQETSSLSPQQRKFTSGSPVDGNSQGFGSTSHLQSNPSLKQQQRGGLRIASSFPTATWHVPGSSNSNFLHATGAARDKPGDGQVLLDPGDWDPNYSEELLLEEDCSDVSSLAAEFSRVAVNQDFVPAELFAGVGRYHHPDTSTRRTNGLVQAFSNPPFVHNVRVGHGQSISKPSHFIPHISQASLSRLGQQPFAQNHAVSEWHRTKIHSTSSGPRSPGSRSVSNVLPWGGRANAPPTCHRRRDSGRIA